MPRKLQTTIPSSRPGATFVCSVPAALGPGNFYRHTVWGRVRIRKVGPVELCFRRDPVTREAIHEPHGDYRLAHVTRA